MIQDDAAKQRHFFNIDKHQYAQDAILSPPLHTQLEIQGVLDRLDIDDPGATIVDFGAGTGRLTIPLLQRGLSVLAIDISEQSLSTLATLAQTLSLSRLQTSAALFPGQRFKTLVGADILHHIDLDEQLPKIHAAMEPGGKVIFTEPGGFHPFWYVFITIVSNWNIEKRVPLSNIFYLRSKLHQYGFRDIRITGVGVLPRPLMSWSYLSCRINDVLGDTMPMRVFAYRYLIEATA